MLYFFRSMDRWPRTHHSHLICQITYSLFFLFLAVNLQGCNKAPETYVSESTTIRDNTPECLVPIAEGTVVYSNDYVMVDASNISEGYIMVSYLGSNENVKLQLIEPDYMTYTYNLKKDGYGVFPLSAGSGSYTLGVYENVEGNQYATVFSQEITVDVTNAMGAFLYPNQYVNFTNASQVVSMAE